MCAKPLFRNDRWIRQPTELITAICLADYPSLLRSGCVTVEPGAAAVFYHYDGSVSLHFERCCKILSSVTNITLFTLDPFTLTYQYPHTQLSLELSFQSYNNDVKAFAQKLRFLLNQRLQLFKNDIQQETQEFVRNWLSNSSHDMTPGKGEYELIQYFEQFALDAKLIKSSINSLIITNCPDATPSQDASIGYFIYLKGRAPEAANIIPLAKGEYLIGRASTQKILEERFSYQDGRSYPKIIWFPKAPGPSTIVRVAQVVVKNNRALIYSGWPAHKRGEIMKIKRWSSSDGVTLSQPSGYPLQSFEKLFFGGEPQIELLYIPPMIDNLTVVRDEYLDCIEINGLWASAAHGWENAGNNEKALIDFNRALECSQKSCGSPMEQANILLSICRVMQNLRASPDTIRNAQIEAYRLLDLPMFNVNVIGKVCVQEKPLQLRVLIRNMSKQKHAKEIRIFYSCDDLGIFEQMDFGVLAPRCQAERSFFIKSIPKADKFPVRIAMEFISQEGNPYELLLTDFLEVIQRRSRVDVDGDSGVVSVQVDDQESVPDIHIGRDAGAIFIKITKKAREIG